MAKVTNTYDDLIRLAKQYGVDDNALFVSCANQYAIQQKVIENIKKAIEEEDNLLATKEYVKGVANIYANPLVRELPKHSDSANRTMQVMLDIVTKLGVKKQPTSRLGQMIDE